MKISGSHPSFVTDISRVFCVYPSMQLSHFTLPAWHTPSPVLHAWGSAFERNCAGVTMMQSAYRQAYRQGRCPVTVLPHQLLLSGSEVRVEIWGCQLSGGYSLRVAGSDWLLFKFEGKRPACWQSNHPCTWVKKNYAAKNTLLNQWRHIYSSLKSWVCLRCCPPLPQGTNFTSFGIWQSKELEPLIQLIIP